MKLQDEHLHMYDNLIKEVAQLLVKPDQQLPKVMDCI
jgi:hypothetical protein